MRLRDMTNAQLVDHVASTESELTKAVNNMRKGEKGLADESRKAINELHKRLEMAAGSHARWWPL